MVLFGTVIIRVAVFGCLISLRGYSVRLLFVQWFFVLQYGDTTAVLFGMVIIRYGSYSCCVLQYGDIIAVLFGTVIISPAFSGMVISLLCSSVWLLFSTVIIRAVFFGTVISLWCYSVWLLIGTVIIPVAFFGTVIHCGVLWYSYYSCGVLRLGAITAR